MRIANVSRSGGVQFISFSDLGGFAMVLCLSAVPSSLELQEKLQNQDTLIEF